MARTARASCRRGWARLLPRPTKASVRAFTRAEGSSRRRWRRRVRRRRPRGACARGRATAALALRALVRLQHRLALVGPGVGEAVPPSGETRELAFELAAPAAQIQEVPAGAKARMLEQPVRALAGALLEARLQRPDLLDRRLEPARDRDLLRLLGEHACPSPRTAPGSDLPPPASRAFHVASTSCQSSVANRKPGDTPRSSRTRRSVSASASSMNRWPSGCSRITSISGRRPCERPCARRLRSVSTAWPESSSFCISSNSRAGGDVLDQRRRASGSARRSSDRSRRRAWPRAAPRAASAPGPRAGASPAAPISFSWRARMSATPPT